MSDEKLCGESGSERRQGISSTGAIALGVGAGAALGVAMHQVAPGVGFGAAVGVIFGMVLAWRRWA